MCGFILIKEEKKRVNFSLNWSDKTSRVRSFQPQNGSLVVLSLSFHSALNMNKIEKRLPGASFPFFSNKLISTWTHTRTCPDWLNGAVYHLNKGLSEGWHHGVPVDCSNRPIWTKQTCQEQRISANMSVCVCLESVGDRNTSHLANITLKGAEGDSQCSADWNTPHTPTPCRVYS